MGKNDFIDEIKLTARFNRKPTVKFAISVFAFLLICCELSFPALLPSEIQTIDAVLSQEAFVSASGRKKHRLILVRSAPLIVEGNTVGAVLIYDDPATNRPEDYFELYDSKGHLVAIGCFDNFGIRRIALDRSLLDGADDLEGIFVSLVGGEPI